VSGVNYFLEPKSEHFFRSGLAKSAFHDKIYESLPLDYYLPFITSTQQVFFALRERVYPKLYQAHDAFLMHYKPYSLVFSSLKKSNKVAPLWRLIIERALKDPQFLDLNKITQNSVELSILAAVKFLKILLFRLDDIEKLQQQYKDALNALSQPQSQQQQKELAQQLRPLIQLIDEATKDSLRATIEAVQEYKEALESAEEAVVALAGGAGGHGFTKEALSVISFLKKPDEFRKHVKLLKYARVFYSKFLATVPTSLVHEQIVSIYGGINGVTRMLSEKQISDVLPSELALAQLGDIGRVLLAVKIAQKQLMTYQRTASIKPVVFVDKSGSMAEKIDRLKKEDSIENPPKISVAAGLALALYRKLSADVYLFDTEVEKVNPARVVEVLLKIEADGGTNIDPVLEEIVNLGKQEYLYLIISDGITEASTDVLAKFRESGLAKRTKLILIPPASTSYNWVQLLRQYNNVMYASDVVAFESAAKRALESL
jgi:uncharacterized protein with von Willebrand factor type A (vWA) domain